MLKRAALVLLVLAFAFAVPAAAQGPRVIMGRAQIGYTSAPSAPELKCVDGTPTGQPFPQCSAGTTRVIGRSEVQIWDPGPLSRSVSHFLNGSITFVVNCDMNGSYRGPCWGTFEWVVPGVGTWAGFWTAPVMDLFTYESKMSMVGVGSGGQIDGKHLMLDGGSAAGEYYITMSVLIW